MNLGRTIFSPLMEFLPAYKFQLCVERYHGNRYVKEFSCLDQFLCLAFAQLTFRESLRDIEACLRAQQSKLYHMGFRGGSRAGLSPMPTSILTGASTPTSPKCSFVLATCIANEPLGLEWDETIYALDSTNIDLCLSLFPWAQFRRRKSAVKLPPPSLRVRSYGASPGAARVSLLRATKLASSWFRRLTLSLVRRKRLCGE
jgi:hypothetical protein